MNKEEIMPTIKEELEKYVTTRDGDTFKIKGLHLINYLSNYYVHCKTELQLEQEALDNVDMSSIKIIRELGDVDPEEIITLRENVDKTLSLVV